MGQLVFVYGTLRRFERNHDLLKNAKLVSQQAWTKGSLIDTGKDYPAMLLGHDEYVYGEIYDVDYDVLKQIDELEGYHGNPDLNHYQRTEQLVNSDLGEFKALLYYYPKKVQNSEKIPFGDWRLKKLLDQGTPLYFAYGSCMDHERIEKAGMLTEFRTLGLGLLSEHELRFTVRADDGGRADIVEMQGANVEGIVYEISEQALEYLYNREGVYIGLYRPAVVDVLIQDEVVTLLTFIVINKLEEIAPPNHYLNEIVRGGKKYLSEPYLNQINSRVERLRAGS